MFSYYMIFSKINFFFSPFCSFKQCVNSSKKQLLTLFKNRFIIDVNESTKLRNYKIYFLITEFLSIEA